MNYVVTKNRVNELDRLFDSLYTGGAAAATRVPAVDITESDRGYDIMAELPGFSKEELNIQVKENLLTISAEKGEVKGEAGEGVKVLKRERASRSFKRSFYLPKDASSENIEALLENGLLTLSIAKKEEAKAQLIKVKTK